MSILGDLKLRKAKLVARIDTLRCNHPDTFDISDWVRYKEIRIPVSGRYCTYAEASAIADIYVAVTFGENWKAIAVEYSPAKDAVVFDVYKYVPLQIQILYDWENKKLSVVEGRNCTPSRIKKVGDKYVTVFNGLVNYNVEEARYREYTSTVYDKFPLWDIAYFSDPDRDEYSTHPQEGIYADIYDRYLNDRCKEGRKALAKAIGNLEKVEALIDEEQKRLSKFQ